MRVKTSLHLILKASKVLKLGLTPKYSYKMKSPNVLPVISDLVLHVSTYLMSSVGLLGVYLTIKDIVSSEISNSLIVVMLLSLLSHSVLVWSYCRRESLKPIQHDLTEKEIAISSELSQKDKALMLHSLSIINKLLLYTNEEQKESKIFKDRVNAHCKKLKQRINF